MTAYEELMREYRQVARKKLEESGGRGFPSIVSMTMTHNFHKRLMTELKDDPYLYAITSDGKINGADVNVLPCHRLSDDKQFFVTVRLLTQP